MEKPVEIIELPSRGLLYGGKMPGGEITIQPMGAKEESLLVSRKGRADAHMILDKIIGRCVVSDFPLDELLVSDKFYVLLMIRNISYGDEYSWKVTCPECGFKDKYEVRIPRDFTITLLDDGVREPFYVDLPKCGKRIGYRMLRVSDEKEVERYTRHEYRKSHVEGDPGYIYRLARHITSIDDLPESEEATCPVTEVDISQAMELVENLIGKDLGVFKQALSNSDCGVNLIFDKECNQCGEDFQTLMKFTPDFFRAVPDAV